ncbi:glycosyltransferase [Marinicrinis lubricantis]|uniref:Glycosyltransferase n=1 Tax=Marinicrinis lubricantis TaxID=2086470 RepID=A0ABW1ISY8_9BACL
MKDDYSIKFSFITACYMSEANIEKTIQSVLSQTYPNIEYVIVDGGSTDHTLDLIRKYEDRIDTVISERDEGIYDAFNKGIQAATGDIIYFLNSDDVLEDNTVIEDVANYFYQRKGLLALYGNVRVVDGSYCSLQGRKLTLNDLKMGHRPSHQSFFAKKSILLQAGCFDTSYRIAADFDLMIKLFKEYGTSMDYFPRTVALFQLGGVSSNYRTRWKMLQESERIIHKHFIENVDLMSTEFQNNALYREWLEQWLVSGRGITRKIKDIGLRKAVVFGTLKTALYLLSDLRREEIETVCFIDNDVNKQGSYLEGVPIHGSEWLMENRDAYDVILLSVESTSDRIIMEQLRERLGAQTSIYSWKELIG